MISLGIDIGGTGCKCAAFSDAGFQLAAAYTEYPLSPGQVHLPPELLQDAVFQVIARCTAQLGAEAASIAALTVSSFGESFVALDREGQPLGDILLYFGSGESQAFSRLVEQIGQEPFLRIARILPDPSYSLAGMLHMGAAAARPVWKYLFIAGFLCYRLCGRSCTDVTLACRSLLYDVECRCWSQTLLEACGLDPETLPEVLPTGSIAGTVLPELADRLGLPRRTRIVLGSHDQIVNALGAGVSKPGDAADTSGTCECITPLFPTIPEGLSFPRDNYACVPFLGDSGYVTYAYNISAGSVVRWFRDVLGGAMQEEARQRGVSIYDLLNERCPTEPSGLMLLPFLQGMGGTPNVEPSAAGVIVGLTTKTRLSDLYRAILEAVTFEMRFNQETLRAHGVGFERLFACGGGARSPVWLQIKADILGCEILPVEAEETGAMGSAILGIAAVTGQNPFTVAERFRRCGPVIRPRPKYQAHYDEAYARYRDLRALYLKTPALKHAARV